MLDNPLSLRQKRKSMSEINNFTLEGLSRYLQYGVDPGSGLRAVLENNLAMSMRCLDQENRAQLYELYSLISNEFPGMAWGSPTRVANWIEREDLRKESGTAVERAVKKIQELTLEPHVQDHSL